MTKKLLSRGFLTRKLKWALAILITILAFQSTLQAHANPTWNIQVVDPAGTGGKIALDAHDNPHIIYNVDEYFNTNRTGWNYAVWTGKNWSTQTLISPAKLGDLEWSYPVWNGKNWTIHTIDLEGVSWIHDVYVIRLDSNGNPHIVCSQLNYTNNVYTSEDLRYAYWTGTTWNVQTVDSASYAYWYPSFVLDSHNNPHITYHDTSNDVLKYATWSSSTGWNKSTIDSTGNAQSSVAIDSKGYPHVCYGTYFSLKYASWNGEAWNIQTVDPNRFQGGLHIDLVLDSRDYSHIGFTGDDGLMYAKWTGADWNIQIVKPRGIANSLALDSNDQPHLVSSEVSGSYHGAPRYGNLTYATLENTPSSLLITIIAVTTVVLVLAVLVLVYRIKRKQITPPHTTSGSDKLE